MHAAKKTKSFFYPPTVIARARLNARKFPWAAKMRDRIVRAAEPWRKMDNDTLWGLMFGPSITRSWSVWSDGHCPLCKTKVPLYNWETDPFRNPWKVQCPHCKELFPKNDFGTFYKSGLDKTGFFNPEQADRSLLMNNEKNTGIKNRLFGVDDGEGYFDGKNRWYFIGAYLIYGQWKSLVLEGIDKLSGAYIATGKKEYARKTAIILDRIADIYPEMDYEKQGLSHEKVSGPGYVSNWHDACEETRRMVIAYDMIFDALKNDKELVRFLRQKAETHYLINQKKSFDDIQRNIETNILRDAVTERGTRNGDGKIAANKPYPDICVAQIHAVLGGRWNQKKVFNGIVTVLNRYTKVDGLTGEKGLSGYSTISPNAFAEMIEEFSLSDPMFIKKLMQRCPNLAKVWRFHLDTWCLEKYYPHSGDSGAFAGPERSYLGVNFYRSGKYSRSEFKMGKSVLPPSMFSFLWRLYEVTGDPAFVQALYRGNKNSVEDLPHDLLAENPASFPAKVKKVIKKEGSALQLGSVDKKKWNLAVMRSGKGKNARAMCLTYDHGQGFHAHPDAMNLGLFIKGIDLMPDCGYPPVQYEGGFFSKESNWYRSSSSHNTVVVDGNSHEKGSGKTTLWLDDEFIQAVRAENTTVIPKSKQFERFVSMVNLPNNECYLIDVFHVVGGKEHIKYQHSHFGNVSTKGIKLKKAKDFGNGCLMRNTRRDANPSPGWSVTWKIQDRLNSFSNGSPIRFRYTDLTPNAQVYLMEGWVSVGGYDSTEATWIPRVAVQRRSNKGRLASTFVGIMEPFNSQSALHSIRRLPLHDKNGKLLGDNFVALEIKLKNGERDIHIVLDSKAKQKSVKQEQYNIQFRGQYFWVRFNKRGKVKNSSVKV